MKQNIRNQDFSKSDSFSIKQDENIEHLTKEAAKGGGIVFGGFFVGKVLKLLLQILLTRVLGATFYGLYILGQVVMSIIQQFSLMGLDNGVVRFGSIYKGEKDIARLKGVLLFSLVFATGIALVGAILLFSFAETLAVRVFSKPELATVIKGLVFSIPFIVILMITASFARALRRMEYYAWLHNIINPLAVLLIVAIGFLMGFRLIGAIYGFVIATVISAGAGIYLIWRIFPEVASGLFPVFNVRPLMRYSSVVLLIGFSHILLYSTDRIMLGYFGIAKQVGIYNASAFLALQVGIVLSAFNCIFGPIIADLCNKKYIKQLKSLFQTITRWIISLSLPLCLILVMYSRQFMGIFGKEFIIGWTVLVTLSIAKLVSAGVGGVGTILTMSGRQTWELFNSVALGVLNIILNIILIPKYGILGAAIATSISLVLINLARLIEVYKLFHFHPYTADYLKPFIAGVVGLSCGFFIRQVFPLGNWGWILGLICVGISYFTCLFCLGFNKIDRMILAAVKTKILKI